MAEPAPEIQAVTLRVEIPADDPATPILYANNVGLTYSPHDMTLHFSWFAVPAVATPPAAGAQIDATVRLVGKISIPLSLVRPLAKLLDRQADAWEQSFNLTIPTPPGLRSPDPKQEADSVRSTE